SAHFPIGGFGPSFKPFQTTARSLTGCGKILAEGRERDRQGISHVIFGRHARNRHEASDDADADVSGAARTGKPPAAVDKEVGDRGVEPDVSDVRRDVQRGWPTPAAGCIEARSPSPR